MVNNLKQKTKNAQPLWRYILSPKRVAFLFIATLIFTGFALVSVEKKVSAATGINQTINFQGKVVNSNGTNVADGQYTFVFKIYDAASGGVNPWTETQNNVQVTAGVFRVSLGSVTPISGVDFNTDNIYLGINFNSDGEMTPRVRFASVPYAMNAKTVAGLTVTDTTGTLTIANSKVFTVNNTIGFSGTDGTTFTLPGASGTIVTLDASQILVNKTIGSSGLTFSGASTDITTGTNESLTIAANGTGNVLIQSGSGAQSALIVDKTGDGDIFTASSSGIPKFVIKNDGTASSSAGFVVDGVGSVQSTNNQTLTIGGDSTGDILLKPRNGSGFTGIWTDSPRSAFEIGSNGVLTFSESVRNSYSTIHQNTGGSNDTGTLEFGSLGGDGNEDTTFYFRDLGSAQNVLRVSKYNGTSQFFSGLAIDNDLSVGGNATISGNLTLYAGNRNIQTTENQTLTVGGGSTGDLVIGRTSQRVYLPGFDTCTALETSGGILSCGTDDLGGGSGSNFWQYSPSTGVVANGNLTTDLLLGGTSTQSSKFAVIGIAGTDTPVASVSAVGGTDDTKGIYLSGNGSLQSVRNNTLTIGGSTTGNITLNPQDGSGIVTVNSNGTYLGALTVSQANTAGTGLYMPSGVTTGKLFDVGSSRLTSGIGLYFGSLSSLTSGSLIQDNFSLVNNSAFTGVAIDLSPTRTINSAANVTDTGNFMRIARNINAPIAGGTLNIVGDVAGFSSDCQLQGGTCVDTSNVLELTQNYNRATGAVLNIINNGTGSAAAILSNSGGQSALIINKTGNAGDIFTASASGVTKFSIGLDGTASSSAGFTVNGEGYIQSTNNNQLVLGGAYTGDIVIAPRNSGGRLNLNLTSSNGLFINNTVGVGLSAGNSCISDIVNGIVTGTTACAATGGGANFWQYNTSTGIIAPGNLTAATLFGDTASLSATFRINGSAGSGINPVASVSANTSYAGFVFDQRGAGDVLTASTSGVTQLVLTNTGALGLGLGNGNSPTAKLDVNGMASISSQLSFRNGAGAIQTTGMNVLTVGGDTTGDIYIRPGNSQGIVKILHQDDGTSGLIVTSNETQNTDKTGRIKFGSYDVTDGYVTGMLASSEVAANQLFIGGGSGTENAATVLRFRTAQNVGTLAGTERMRIDNYGWTGIGEIGDANIALQSQLYVTGGSQGANAAVIINQTGIATNDILAASASGTTKFVIKNDGTASTSGSFVLDGSGALQTTNNQKLTIGGSSTGDINIVDSLFLGVDELTNGGLIFYSSGVGETDPSIYADANGNLILSAPTGSVQIGDGTGNISFSLETAADVFIADKTVALSTNYSSDDFTFQRVLTGGAHNQGGAVFTIKDISGGSGTINGDVLLVNSALTSGNFTGYLARFQQNGVDKFRIQGNGTTPVASVAATTSFAGMVVDNTIGDLFTASSSGVTQLILTNNGALGLGLPAGLRPTAKLDVNGAASISGQLVFRSGTGVIQTTGKGTFTIGGDTTGDVFIKPGNTTGLTFLSNGRVGIGTTTPLSTLDVRAQNGTISIASVAGATSFASFVVDNSIGDLFTASSSGITRFTIQQSGTVQIGNLTNGLTFDALNGGPTYNGTGRPTKTITLSPEFSGAILTASGSSTINGSITSDASSSAALNRTYYDWTSTATSLQDYVVALKIKLPKDFSDWATSGTVMSISYNSGSSNTSTNGLDVYIYNSADDSTGRPVYFSTNNVSAKSWTTINLTAGQLDNNASPDWDSADESVTIYLKMKSSGTYNYTQVGDIVINYLSKF